MRLRWRALAGLVATALTAGGWSASQYPASAEPTPLRHKGHPPAPAGVLQLYYSPPVLVRAGERIRLPVEVVCASPEGNVCPARVTIGTRAGQGEWDLAESEGSARLEFDVTAPARRAATAGAEGSVDFFIRADGPGGAHASLGEASSPLRFYLADRMPVVRLPRIPFGRIRRPNTVLFLPWGSGPLRAGIQLGNESATLGPSSFDVDSHGRILLLDGLQGREAMFSRRGLQRQTSVGVIGRGDVAVTPKGVSYVLSQRRSALRVQRVDRQGRLSSAVSMGQGILSRISTAGERPFVDVLPLDAWVPVAAGSTSAAASRRVPRPLGAGNGLVSVATDSSVRLGTVRGKGVTLAVELRSPLPFGELALAEPDGRGGYWAVVRVWRGGSQPADQYQVVHESGDHIVDTFAVADRRFAGSAPLARFRLGPNGDLYQMMSEPDGLRIVRYDLGGTP